MVNTVKISILIYKHLTDMKFKLFALVITLFSATLYASDSLKFDNTWVRLSPPVSANSAGYFTLKNLTDKDISVTAISTPVSRKAELHDMTMVNGTMGMVHMPDFTIKANEMVEFKPAGKHLMLVGLNKPLKLDQTIDVTFTFSDETSQTVSFTVKRTMKPVLKSVESNSEGAHKHH